jgi:hypothetical protein
MGVRDDPEWTVGKLSGVDAGWLARSESDWQPQAVQTLDEKGPRDGPAPKKGHPIGTLKSVEKQAGIKLR